MSRRYSYIWNISCKIWIAIWRCLKNLLLTYSWHSGGKYLKCKFLFSLLNLMKTFKEFTHLCVLKLTSTELSIAFKNQNFCRCPFYLEFLKPWQTLLTSLEKHLALGVKCCLSYLVSFFLDCPILFSVVCPHLDSQLHQSWIFTQALL